MPVRDYIDGAVQDDKHPSDYENYQKHLKDHEIQTIPMHKMIGRYIQRHPTEKEKFN